MRDVVALTVVVAALLAREDLEGLARGADGVEALLRGGERDLRVAAHRRREGCPRLVRFVASWNGSPGMRCLSASTTRWHSAAASDSRRRSPRAGSSLTTASSPGSW